MITHISPSKRKPKYTPVVQQQQTTNPLKTLFNEASRRDAIIKGMVARLDFKVGDILECYTEQARDEMGDILVEKIVDTYGKFGRKEEWPTSDVPMIIHGYSKKKDYRFLCTPGYVRKKL